MPILRLILGDQLSHRISSLKDCDKTKDIILICEVRDETTYVKHHKKKIAYIFSAMRHFAAELISLGYKLHYTKLDDVNNTGSFRGEVKRALDLYQINHIVTTFPGEYRVLSDMKKWSDDFGIPVDILPDDRFYCSIDSFAKWANNRTQLRMEYFYREMRKEHQILMDGTDPIGGKWNYDANNRKPADSDLHVPKPYVAKHDAITQEVLKLVANQFDDHFGDIEPFYFAVNRAQALEALDHFIEQRLPQFGDFQDAMISGEPWMFHSHLSFYLNSGLLLPQECVAAAELAYKRDKAPLNAVEGFIRQILGWREFVRGIYWLEMPGYAEKNYFNAKRKLPEFYWTANSKMNCLNQCVIETKQNSYAHHIQRLMVLGNFALLAGIDPKFLNEWFLIVYADAYEWVELPNVSGMVLYADGGLLASKPYAAGGAYINKMSDYCKSCQYQVGLKTGPDACPFNYLYWNFLANNRDKLESNHRVSMMYKTYDKMDDAKKQEILNDSIRFLDEITED